MIVIQLISCYLATNQAQLDNNPLDISIKILLDLAKKRNKFATLVLKLWKKSACYYKNISLVEYKDQNRYLYFWNQC